MGGLPVRQRQGGNDRVQHVGIRLGNQRGIGREQVGAAGHLQPRRFEHLFIVGDDQLPRAVARHACVGRIAHDSQKPRPRVAARG